jgi:N-acetylmuramoyl-L-alanine amidase
MSIILASTIFIESILAWLPPIKSEVKTIEVPQVIVEETISDTIDIIEEPVEEIEEVVEIVEVDEPIVQNTSTNTLSLSESDIDLIALVTMVEAEGECDEGKRLVIDVILNRYDSSRFPNTISGVIYARNAFECMWNGRVDRCIVRDDIRQLVVEELQSRTNSNIHYFRTNHYHNFGVPVVNVGNHYFSTY